jgi:hypothetical protein
LIGRAYSTHGKEEKCNKILVGKHAETTKKLRRRLEDNINKDLKGIEWEGIVWIHLAEVRDQWRALVNMFRIS